MINQFILTINHFSALIQVKNLNNGSMQVGKALDRFAELTNLHVVKKITYTFEPIGETLVYILSESHLAIHTWPEHELIHLNLVSHSKIEKETIKDAITQSFSAFEISNLTLTQHDV